MEMNGTPPDSPKSWVLRTFLWEIFRASRISCLKRWTRVGSFSRASLLRSLRATGLLELAVVGAVDHTHAAATQSLTDEIALGEDGSELEESRRPCACRRRWSSPRRFRPLPRSGVPVRW